MPTLDYTSFIAMFPEFASVSQPTVQTWYNLVPAYIQPSCLIGGAVLQQIYNLMTAYLMSANGLSSNNGGSSSSGGFGSVASMTAGSVSVSYNAPMAKNAFEAGLYSSPYGQQIAFILSVQSAGGVNVGLSSEQQAYRKAGGIF